MNAQPSSNSITFFSAAMAGWLKTDCREGSRVTMWRPRGACTRHVLRSTHSFEWMCVVTTQPLQFPNWASPLLAMHSSAGLPQLHLPAVAGPRASAACSPAVWYRPGQHARRR